VDRRAKERLIGACILVALAVAVVPEMLSGPKPAAPAAEAPRLPAGAPDPVRNVTVDLTTSKPTVASTPTPMQAPTPTPAQAQAQAQAPAPMSAPDAAASGTPAPSASAPAPLETPGPPPTSGQTFLVQLGSFANRGNAERLVRQLKAQGFSIYMAAEGSGRSARYRVRVGPLSDRDSAERTAAKLKSLGHAAAIIAPR